MTIDLYRQTTWAYDHTSNYAPTHNQVVSTYFLSTLYVAHVILDTRPSRFSREYNINTLKEAGWGLGTRLICDGICEEGLLYTVAELIVQ